MRLTASTTPTGLRERRYPHADHRGILVPREARHIGNASLGVSEVVQGYLNEYVWRYNRRDDDEPMFDQLLRRAATA